MASKTNIRPCTLCIVLRSGLCCDLCAHREGPGKAWSLERAEEVPEDADGEMPGEAQQG